MTTYTAAQFAQSSAFMAIAVEDALKQVAKTNGQSFELACEAIAREMDRLGYGHHESHAQSILRALLDAAPHEHEWDINAEGTATVCYCGARSSDAPAVKRQELSSPLSDLGQAQLLAICRGAAQRCEEQHAYMASASSDPHNWFPHKWVLDAMSSLLQINANNLQSTIVQLQARIGKLESGRAEPVTMDGKTTIREYVADSVPEDQIGDDWTKGYEECKRRIHRMFQQPVNNPPAPVAAVINERQEFESWASKSFGLRESRFLKENGEYISYSTQCFFDVWKARACLDATAALNTPKPAEWHDVAGDDEGLVS